MASFEEQKQQVLSMCAEAARLVKERGAEHSAEEIGEAAKTLEAGKLAVAVVGEFKRGKSSLINALIEEPGLFPVDQDIATNLVTTVTYGESERVGVVLDAKNGDGVREQEITREQIADFATEGRNKGNERGSRLLTVVLPNEKLKDLAVIDTPGVGGLNTEHTTVTTNFLTRSDIVLFVLDAMTPLTTKELDFLETVAEHAREILFVVTKIDRSPDFEEIVGNTRRKVASVLGRPADELTIVPVSSFAKLEYLRSGDEEDLEESNFPALEEALWGTLRKRGGAITLLRALGVLSRNVDAVIEPLETELEAYSAKTKGELDRKEHEFEAEAQRRVDLKKGSAGWLKTLKRALEATTRELETRYERGSLEIRNKLRGYVDDEGLLRDPQQILSLLERDIAFLADDLAKRLDSQTNDISARLAEETGLELNPAAPGVSIAAEASAPSLEGVSVDSVAGGKLLEVGRGGWMYTFFGSAAGGIAGGLLTGGAIGSAVPGPGTIIGGAIGAIFGFVQGSRNSLKQVQERDRQKLRSETLKRLDPFVSESLQEIKSTMRGAVAVARDTINDGFMDLLEEERSRVEDSLQALKAARGRTQEEATARMKELRGPLTQLQRMRQAVDASAKAALSEVEPAGVAEDVAVAPQPAGVASEGGGDAGDWADD